MRSAFDEGVMLLAREPRRLKLTAQELKGRRKSDEDRARIVRHLAAETTMTLKWIASQLGVGSASKVKHCLNHK